jgi:hypothetical protein
MVQRMKPLIILGLWTVLGLDLGAWTEAVMGIPAGLALVTCIAAGAALAVAARRQIAARAASGISLVAAQVSPFEAPSTLERAA